MYLYKYQFVYKWVLYPLLSFWISDEETLQKINVPDLSYNDEFYCSFYSVKKSDVYKFLIVKIKLYIDFLFPEEYNCEKLTFEGN